MKHKILQLIIAITFILSGALKALSLNSFEQEVFMYADAYLGTWLLPFASLVASGICVVEILLGILYLFDCFPLITGTSLVLLLMFFTYLTGRNLLLPSPMGRIEDCGCFGEFIHFSPTSSFIKSACMLLLAALNTYYSFRTMKVKSLVNPANKHKKPMDMKKATLLFLPFLIATFICACQTDVHRYVSNENVIYDDSIIYSPNIVYDFGKIHKDSTNLVKFSFILKNISDRELYIKSVEAMCPCVTINKSDSLIHPDEEIRISGAVNISKLKGFFNKPIFIRYDNDKILLCRIKGRIE